MRWDPRAFAFVWGGVDVCPGRWIGDRGTLLHLASAAGCCNAGGRGQDAPPGLGGNTACGRAPSICGNSTPTFPAQDGTATFIDSDPCHAAEQAFILAGGDRSCATAVVGGETIGQLVKTAAAAGCCGSGDGDGVIETACDDVDYGFCTDSAAEHASANTVVFSVGSSSITCGGVGRMFTAARASVSNDTMLDCSQPAPGSSDDSSSDLTYAQMAMLSAGGGASCCGTTRVTVCGVAPDINLCAIPVNFNSDALVADDVTCGQVRQAIAMAGGDCSATTGGTSSFPTVGAMAFMARGKCCGASPRSNVFYPDNFQSMLKFPPLPFSSHLNHHPPAKQHWRRRRRVPCSLRHRACLASGVSFLAAADLVSFPSFPCRDPCRRRALPKLFAAAHLLSSDPVRRRQLGPSGHPDRRHHADLRQRRQPNEPLSLPDGMRFGRIFGRHHHRVQRGDPRRVQRLPRHRRCRRR